MDLKRACSSTGGKIYHITSNLAIKGKKKVTN